MSICRKPYFEPGARSPRIRRARLWTFGKIDATSATDDDETNRDLAVMKGSGRSDHFRGYCNNCWKYGHKVSQCSQTTTDMKGKCKGGEQDKGKGKGFFGKA